LLGGEARDDVVIRREDLVSAMQREKQLKVTY
jgi:hypothetical protein